MERFTTSGPIVYFAPQDRRDAKAVARACDRAVAVLAKSWGLRPPADCQVWVTRDGRDFVTASAPTAWRALLVVTRPIWSRSLAKSWRFSGGLSQHSGRRWVIGVQPMDLMGATDPGVQHRLFVPEDDMEQKVRHVVCHELAHAATASLQLPDWLDEGLAMLTVDRCLGKATVQPRTIDLLGHLPRRSERKHPVDVVLRQYAQAYWLTRYVDEERPEVLRKSLAATKPGKAQPLGKALATTKPGDLGTLRDTLVTKKKGEVEIELARAFRCDRTALVLTLEQAAYERFGPDAEQAPADPPATE